MVRVLDRKLMRELWHQKGLIIAITTLISVGVMCFIYMRSITHNLKRAKARYYATSRMADFWIDVKKVPVAELDVVTNLRGIAEIRPRIKFLATVDLPHVPEPVNGLVLSLPDRRRPIINEITLKSGSYFSDQGRDEVLINEAFAVKHKLKAGDRIHLLLNNRRQELQIIGTASSSEFVYLVGPGAIFPDPEHFGVFYLKETFAEEVFDFSGACNQIVGTVAPEFREQPDELLRQVERVLKPYGVFSVTPLRDQPSNRYLSDEIRGIGSFAQIMPVIFLAVAALVLNVLMLRLIEQQRVVIGTLKGLGYSNAQLFIHYTKYSGLIGIVGGLGGWGLGYVMAGLVTDLYRTFFEFPDLRNEIYPDLYALGLMISFGCALLGSLNGARGALSLQPAEAMRTKPPAKGAKVWIEHIPFVWTRLSSGWRMVLRNIMRHKLRTAVGIFAAAMGTSIMSCGFVLQNALRYLIDFQFTKISRSDVDIYFKDDRSPEAWKETRLLPGVDYAEPFLDVPVEFFNGPYRRKGVISGLSPTARLTTPRTKQGEPIPIPENGVAMTRKLAELLHLKAGDMIEIEPVKGIKQRKRVPITTLNDSYIGLSVYADINYLSRLVGEEAAVNGVQLKIDSRAGPKRELAKAIKEIPAVQSYIGRQAMIDNLQHTLVEMQDIFIGFMVFFAGVIFFASLLNMSLISLAERRREIATLLVQGYSEWQVGGLFLRESLVVDVIGTLLGMPLGYALCIWLTIVYDTEMFRFPLISPPIVWIKTMVMAGIFALLAHVFVHRAIVKMDWRDALSVKE